MNRSQAAAKTLSAAIVMALASLASAAPAQVNAPTAVAYSGEQQSAPYESLGGIGGRNTARAESVIVVASDEHGRSASPFGSLGGVGGQGTARADSATVVALHDGQRPHEPWESLGGIGGRATA